jgi:cell division septation protein DedD
LGAAALGAFSLSGAEAQGEKQPPAAKAKKQDPAEAQRAIEAAGKLLKSGKAAQAAQSLSATMAGGNLPPAILAKALYVRGLAYREQRKLAHAISDLNSALWLKGGLGGEERADATRKRIEAYADAGLTEHGQPLAPATADAGRAKTSSGNWLGNLFGASNSGSPPPARRKVEPPVVAKVEPGAAGGGWSSRTEVQSDRTAAAPPPRAAPPPAREPPPARSEGGYRVQLAPVRTRGEAVKLAAKAKREHGAILVSEPQIEVTVLGNMGSFYRVRFGPFASANETQAVCARLQGSGLDCMPVGH